MRHWWAKNREAAVNDLTHHAKSLLDLQKLSRHGSEEKINQDQPPYRGRSEKNKTRGVTAVHSSGTPTTSRKAQSSETVSHGMVNPVMYASSECADMSDSIFLDSREYCHMCYASNHAILQSGHIADADRFVISRNRNIQLRFGLNRILESCTSRDQPIR